MKLYWIQKLFVVASVAVPMMLYGTTAKAQKTAENSTQTETAQTTDAPPANSVKSEDKSETPETVSWDDGAAPGPANLKQPPKAGKHNRAGNGPAPRMKHPGHEQFDAPPPPMNGPMPGTPDDMGRVDMGRPMPPPPMGEAPPQGPGNPHNRNEVMGPPPTGPFQNWEELKKADPEFFELLKKDAELERQTRQLTMQYRQATSNEAKAEIGKKLEQTVAEHFDVRQKRRAMELERLEKELNRLKTLFEKRNQQRDSIIEQRVKELRGDEGSLF